LRAVRATRKGLELMTGKTISHYEIVQYLGGGGMGVVYRAVDRRLGREVAIKLLPQSLTADATALARFDREARLASSLSHPNICTVHDVGTYESQPFIVMELCQGRTLAQILQDGPLPLERVIDVGVQVAEALEAAHHRGIAHRDIKPGNLFIAPDGQVKVLDFGLAKLSDEHPAAPADLDDSAPTAVQTTELTRPGFRVGTVAYMSPEQARGQSVDGRTDLFSLGAVLYEAATGVRAFPGENFAVVITSLLNLEPIPPRMINPGVPPGLEQLLHRALSKDRDQRYPGAADMLADLHRLQRSLGGRPAEHRATGHGSVRSRQAAVRRPGTAVRRLTGIVVGVACLALVAIAVAVGFGRGAPLTDRDSVLLAGFENHTGEEVFDGTLTQALAVQLMQSPFLNLVTDDRVRETLTLMRRDPQEWPSPDLARDVCQRLGASALLQGSISRLGSLYVLLVEASSCATGASLAREQGSASSKEEVLSALGELSSPLRKRLGESLRSVERFDVPVAQATTASLEALRAYTLGLAERARGAEVESIPFFERALALDPAFAAAAITLSTVYGSIGETGRSEEHARRAFAQRDRVSERERLLITYQYHDRVTGDLAQAADTLEIWKRTYPRDFRPANALALLHNRLGMYDRAIAEAQEALARSPGHSFPLSNLSMAYRGLGRLSEARATAEEAVGLGVATVPTRRVLYQLGVLMADAALAERELAWARGNAREYDLLAARAQVAAFEGRLREAAEGFRTSSELAERRRLRETAAGFAAHEAWTSALFGDGERALEAARRALGDSQSGTIGNSLPRIRAIAALAMVAPAEAEKLGAAAAERYPQGTLTQGVLLPVIRAAAALARESPEQAVAYLEAASPYEKGTVAGLIPIYLRGEAYLRLGDGARAGAEFARVLAERGADPFAPVVALARLGQARALRAEGQHARSARAYDEFLTSWAAADPDLPILAQALSEQAGLAEQITSR
jgi:eukaryotic-like serine/threonine-protein kinase